MGTANKQTGERAKKKISYNGDKAKGSTFLCHSVAQPLSCMFRLGGGRWPMALQHYDAFFATKQTFHLPSTGPTFYADFTWFSESLLIAMAKLEDLCTRASSRLIFIVYRIWAQCLGQYPNEVLGNKKKKYTNELQSQLMNLNYTFYLLYMSFFIM